jgi:hypothetical protein
VMEIMPTPRALRSCDSKSTDLSQATKLHAAESLFSRTDADAALVNAHCFVLK